MTRKSPAPRRGPASSKPAGGDRRASTNQIPGWWLFTLVVGIAALALAASVRHAPLGVPVADDYAFLDRLQFQHPLDVFDSMGATYYWRPVSRQLYFSLLGGTLLTKPWIVVALHGLLLLASCVLLYRLSRAWGLSPSSAALIACYPMASEASRVLLTWPSSAQHLLAMTCAILAAHEAVAGRKSTAFGAALCGVLSHESCALVLPLLPFLLAHQATPASSGREIARAWFLVGVVVVLWQVGYAIARGHGVALPPTGEMVANAGSAWALGVAAALNLETAPAGARGALLIGYAALGGGALWFSFQRNARQAVRRHAPLLLAGFALFLLGTLPLAALLPDWNAWRDSVPGLALGVALTALLSLLSPWLGAGLVLLRLLALVLATPAPTTVTADPPSSVSDMSFVRLSRLQRLAEGTRRVVGRDLRTSPPAKDLRTFGIPRMSEVAFQGSLAPRVWLRDPAVTLAPLGGARGMLEARGPVLAYYADSTSWEVVLLDREAVRLLGQGVAAINAQQLSQAHDFLLAGRRAQARPSATFEAMIDANLAIVAYSRGAIAEADSLNERAGRSGGRDTNYWALASAIALSRGQYEYADKAALTSLGLDPGNAFAASIHQALTQRTTR